MVRYGALVILGVASCAPVPRTPGFVVPEGRVAWTVAASGFPSAVASRGDRIAIGGTFVGVFDGAGTKIWLTDRSADAPATSVGTDGDGNVIVAGIARHPLDGRGMGHRVFVAKLDRDGHRVFEVSFDPGSRPEELTTRAVVNRRGSIALLYQRATDAYAVRRFTPSGEDGIEHSFSGRDELTSIALDDDDNLYVASPGTMMKIGPDQRTSRYTTSGEVTLPVLALDSRGRLIVGASCRGSVAIAGMKRDLPARWQACVAAIERDGRGAWLHTFGGGIDGSAVIRAIASGPSNEIVIGGASQLAVDFLPSSTLLDTPFVLALDREGNPEWAKRLGGAALSSVTIDGRGTVVVTGRKDGELAVALARP